MTGWGGCDQLYVTRKEKEDDGERLGGRFGGGAEMVDFVSVAGILRL